LNEPKTLCLSTRRDRSWAVFPCCCLNERRRRQSSRNPAKSRPPGPPASGSHSQQLPVRGCLQAQPKELQTQSCDSWEHCVRGQYPGSILKALALSRAQVAVIGNVIPKTPRSTPVAATALKYWSTALTWPALSIGKSAVAPSTPTNSILRACRVNVLERRCVECLTTQIALPISSNLNECAPPLLGDFP